MGNRFMLHTRFNIRNDPCDEKLLIAYAVFQCLACIVSMLADSKSAEACDAAADCVNAAFCACMLTQQDIQIKAIEQSFAATPYAGMPPHILVALPPQQQEMLNSFQPSAPPLLNAPAQNSMSAPSSFIEMSDVSSRQVAK
jgi:hypothetical protein